MVAFICKLKEFRQAANMTQEELASQVSVRRETIIRLEAGKYNPSLKMAIDIARTVKAPIEEIFVFEEEQ
ncbi:MAG: helix-turn-helix transcriptional regulator [Brevinema sp.]